MKSSPFKEKLAAGDVMPPSTAQEPGLRAWRDVLHSF
jgi:hypothetical protein